ncbi:hypothetical protein C1H46_031550 [Malus baccata]|uniref:Uncharacterized protein n=1 Tax=Malus baccata TaxID=106549 RepID=A0A540L8Q6_MALBA|nr:hypothetical protein C1H46_031550 [Malus baccata]
MRRLGLVNIGQAAGEREAAAVAATKTRLPVKRTKPSFHRPFRVAPPRSRHLSPCTDFTLRNNVIVTAS